MAGTNNSSDYSPLQYNTLIGDANGGIVNGGTGTSGEVWTSNGASANPTWQAAAGGGITTLDGDSGSATGSTVTIKTGNSTPSCGSSVKFAGSGSTLTFSVSDAHSNVLIGFEAGNLTLTGGSNCGYGFTSLSALTTGATNSGYGYNTLDALKTGARNLALGYFAGSGYTGAESSNILLANNGTLGESNTIRIGTQGSSTGQQNLCYIAGIAGGTLSAGSPTAHLTLTDTSDGQVVCPTPVQASAASSTYGSLAVGTALQNTATYPILVNVSMAITAATGAVILVGVGSTSSPTAQAVTASFSTTGTMNFSFIVPSKFYAEVTTTGTITVGSITTFACQVG